MNKPLPGAQINWAHPLAKGLVYYGLMNEGAGSQVWDYSGSRNPAAINGATWEGEGLGFDGVKDNANTSLNNKLSGSPGLTVLILVKPTTLNNIAFLFTQGGLQSIAGYVFSMRIFGATGLGWQISSGTNQKLISVTVAEMIAGEKIHLAGTWNPGKMEIFKDGISVISTSTGVPASLNTISAVFRFANEDRLLPAFFFNGAFITALIYNRTLSDAEIRWHRQNPYAMFHSSLPWWMYSVPQIPFPLDIFNPQVETNNYDKQITATNYDNQVETNNHDNQIEWTG